MVGIKTDAPSLALVGVGGFGPVHIANIHRLAQAGQAQLAALISGGGLARLGETVPANIAAFAASVPGYPTLDDYLADGSVADIVVLCTPIHTHVPLAIAAMKAGANVLLEKPPTPSLADFERLLGVASDTGQAIQVGFQSFGSQALPALAAIIEDGVLGEVIGVGAVGTWSRSVAYFTRSSWAGKRTLDGVPVCDGVVTNPLAHAVATALKIAGATRLGDLASVDLDLYRANDIDCDDTSALRCVTKGGVTVGLGLTLAADEQASPYVTVRGTKGRATLFYADDLLKLAIQGQPETSETYGRTDLTENLIDHLRDPSVSLLCPLDEIGAFTTVLDTVASSADPRRIPGSFLSRLERDGATWVVVPKVDHWCRQVAEEAKTFAELGAPWVGAQRVIMDINFDGETVGRYVDGLDASALDCPRPHFHPLTTLGGVIVTDDSPPDHSWHAGLGWAIQDIARDGQTSHNLWGGPTYQRDLGYQWLDDHGRIVHLDWCPHPSGFGGRQTLEWRDRDDQTLLDEVRRLQWVKLDDVAWALRWTTELTTTDDRAVTLGSAGSNGRVGAGYGGFFWRLPAGDEVRVWTPSGEGEAAVHGSRGPWLAWSALSPETRKPYTVVISGDDEASLADPFFVRVRDYPAISSALAWSERTTLRSLARSFTAVVADGWLEDQAIFNALARARESLTQ